MPLMEITKFILLLHLEHLQYHVELDALNILLSVEDKVEEVDLAQMVPEEEEVQVKSTLELLKELLDVTL